MSSLHSQLRPDIKLSMITLYKTSKRRTIHDSDNKQPSSISDARTLMGKGHFRPPQRRNPLTDLNDTNLKYIATHRRPPYAKSTFDPTTWVVWANSQFATVLVSFFFSFLFSSARLQVAPADESSPLYAK